MKPREKVTIKKFTKCNISNNCALKNNGKFTDYNLKKLYPWFLALRESVYEKSVLGLGLGFFFESLASKVGSWTPPLITAYNKSGLDRTNFA